MGCSDSKHKDDGWKRDIVSRPPAVANGMESRFGFSRNVSIDAENPESSALLDKYCDRMEERIKLLINQRFGQLETCVTTIYMGAEVRLSTIEKKLLSMEVSLAKMSSGDQKEEKASSIKIQEVMASDENNATKENTITEKVEDIPYVAETERFDVRPQVATLEPSSQKTLQTPNAGAITTAPETSQASEIIIHVAQPSGLLPLPI